MPLRQFRICGKFVPAKGPPTLSHPQNRAYKTLGFRQTESRA